MDKNGRMYQDFDDFKENNKLPKSAIIAPRNGTYTPSKKELDKDERIVLEVMESPSASILSRIVDITQTVVSVAGIAMSVTGVVSCLRPQLFSKAAQTAIKYGSFALSGYTISK
jgi:hypothetical protein